MDFILRPISLSMVDSLHSCLGQEQCNHRILTVSCVHAPPILWTFALPRPELVRGAQRFAHIQLRTIELLYLA